ncbi:MAG TPA: VOC family protein [Trebonia sp.]
MTETKTPPPPNVWPTLCARAVAHGAKVTQELHDTDYGSRDFAIEDPEGNRWAFGTYPGAPR